jgi:hypothetical protein
VEIEKRSTDFTEVKFKNKSTDSNVDAHLLGRNSISEQFGRMAWLLEPPHHVSIFGQIE